MKTILPALRALVLALIGLCAVSLKAQPAGPGRPAYASGYSAIMRLGKDLHGGLAPEHRQQISTRPIFLETDFTPSVKLVEYDTGSKPLRAVFISAGFVELVNHIAHAKAIDGIEKGYFNQYVASLMEADPAQGVPPLPRCEDPRFWTDDMLNEQLSNFNSIVGVVVGIKLAHHYLGHFKKYGPQIEDESGNQRPISNLLTRDEWREALDKGVENSLNAGCAVEGVVSFFDAFGRMARRPAWAANFLPDSAKPKDLAKELTRMQKKLFIGK